MKWLALIIFAAASVDGATYYVDFAGGSDAANGTSTSTPWAHCPGDSLATGTAAGTTLSAGDSAIFKGGVEYKSTVTLNYSGTAGNVVTYDGNSAESFGSGKAILNGEHTDSDSRRYGFFTGSARSNILIKNFECKGFGGHASITWTCGGLAASVAGFGVSVQDCSLVTVKDCYFYDMGDWTNAANMNENRMDGVGVRFYNSATQCTVTNCEFTQCGRGGVVIDVRNSSTCTNIEVSGCSIHDYVRWGIEVAANSVNCTIKDIRVKNNTIANCYQYAPGTWLGCSGAYPHFDGIICLIGGSPQYDGQVLGTSAQPFIISGNRFYNNSATATDAGTAEIFLTAYGGRLIVCNNVFINTLSSGFGGIYMQDGIKITETTTQPEYLFFNNSFLDMRGMVTLRTLNSDRQVTNGVVRIKNNIFYKTDNGANEQLEWGLDSGLSTPTELDYNIYVTGRPDGLLASSWMPGDSVRTYRTFSDLQGKGFEAHGAKVDPKYVNVSFGLGAKSSQNDLHLQLSSPAINAGADLSAFFTTDKDGNARGPAWDMGAYEFIGHANIITGGSVLRNAVLQ